MALQQPQQPQLQMSWQPSLLSQKRKTGPPLGFRNLGNSCYLNSVLQCLTYTPPLANFCLRSLHTSRCDSIVDAQRKRDCPFCIVEKRIARSLQKDLVQDAPLKFQSCLSLFAEHFRIGRQEDAHEFLRYVIDACHNTCLRLKKLRQQQRKGSELLSNGGNTIVKEIFGGALQSQVKCLPCGAESNKIDEIMDISLDIMSSSSLKDAMHKFFQPEVLDGNNKYKCENCKKLVPARKQMSVFQAPNILVIQLKRFGGGIFGRKIDKMISFQEVLVLSSFMCKASQDPLPEYSLFGTIVHAGCSPDSGHYYAYIKDPIGRWYRCNDAFVSLATLEEVLSEKVYVLFFSRSKQRPQSVKTSVVNGVKSRDFSGSETSKSEASSPPPKLAMKPQVQESSCKVMPAPSKIDKVPFGHRMKFPIAGNGSKTAPSSSNGKVDPHKNVLIETTEDRDHGHINNREKHLSTSNNGNCSDKENEFNLSVSKKNEVVATASSYGKNNGFEASDAKKSQAFVSENGNGHIGNGGGLYSVKLALGESNGAVSRKANGQGSEPAKLQKSSSNGQTDALRVKRKLQDGYCRLLGQDAPSKADIEEMKKWLEREAKSKLRTSAWPNEVEAFMRSKKRSRVGKLGNTSKEFELLKQKMIEDAKGVEPSFLSQVPPPLMQGLINHLRIFFEEKR